MGRNAKQVDDLVLKVGELGIEDLDSVSILGQLVAFGVSGKRTSGPVNPRYDAD
jgi:hypothetical protein